MWAVVGLGNPGRRYSATRHNVGFLFVRNLAKSWKVRLRKRAFLSKACYVERKNEKVLLTMPQTYMNQSGLAVKNIMEAGGVKPENLIIIYDDLDIPLGEIRIRKGGGPGTHKGMVSIVKETQSVKFPRIRIGIGPLNPDEDAVDYVLSPFEKEEKPFVEEGVQNAEKALDLILSGETEKAMNTYNRKGKRIQEGEYNFQKKESVP